MDAQTCERTTEATTNASLGGDLHSPEQLWLVEIHPTQWDDKQKDEQRQKQIPAG
jgi:hypothetical protein